MFPRIVLFSFTNFTAPLLLVSKAVRTVDSSLVALCAEMEGPFISLISLFIYRMMPGPLKLLGLGFAVWGLLLIAESPGISLSGVPGLLMGLGAAASWAGSAFLVKRIDIDPVSLTVWGAFLGFTQCFALLLTMEPESLLLLSNPHRDALFPVTLSSAACFGGFLIWNFLIRKHSEHSVAPFVMLVPVWSLIFSWLYWHHSPQREALMGLVLCLAGIGLQVLSDRKGQPVRVQKDEALG